MQFSKDQLQAIATITQWMEGDEKVAVLGGLAGTGKTTVTAHLIENVFPKDGVVVACPTGKAASVLRRKGVAAFTIHSIAYTFLGKVNKELQFEFNDDVPCDILVVDEASMVDLKVHKDLMSSNARILYVGDYGQLPPVGDDPHIMKDMTAKLTHVHRQGDDLLDYAHCIREGELWDFDTPNVVKHRKGSDEARLAIRLADIVICVKNSTRHRANLSLFFQAMGITHAAQRDMLRAKWFQRDMVGFFEGFLGRSIRVMCIKNNPATDLWNGTLGVFELETLNAFEMGGLFIDEEGEETSIGVSLEGWGTNPGDVDWDRQEKKVALDLGYAITGHKSQGSEWSNVVVLDEGMRTHRNRWRYTAATRAKKQLVWIPAGRRTQ